MGQYGRSSQRGVRARVRHRVVHAIALISLALMPLLASLPPAPASMAAQQTTPGEVIVVLADRTVPPELQQFLNTLPITLAFTNVFNGFVANLTEAQVSVLAQSDVVAGIFPNLPVTLALTDATGVRRIGAPSGSSSGVQPAVNATAAVIDSGVQADHPNLNVVGGFDGWGAAASGSAVNCGALTPEQATLYEDQPGTSWGSNANHGHGTHVAGIIGARGLDNVVGVAPGAGIVGVRVFNESRQGTIASIVCGIDWVIANKDRFGGIDAINMSIQGPAVAGGCSSDAWHVAICAATNAGIPVIASAGNTTGTNPTIGLYDEVIAVSAFNDYDGRPGGLATSKPAGCSTSQLASADDRFATYSLSLGADVMAPGTCIYSTWTGSGYDYSTGTSMAAPHVTGTVMLLAASSPSPSPAAARDFVLANSVSQGDPAGLVVTGASAGEPVLHLGESPVPPIVALPVSQSFQSNGAAPASVVYDGDLSTVWTSASGAPASAFFTLDLGEIKPIGTLRWVYGSGYGGLADAWQIQLSNDNLTWVTIRNRGNASPLSWQEQVINRNARYVRFFYTNPRGDAQLGGVAEVEVLPAEGATSDLPEPTPTPVPVDPYPITNAGRSSGSAHPSLAYDDNMSTVWVTTSNAVPTSAYIYFSLGSAKPIGTIRYVFGSGYGGLADSWQIQVSNDRVNWVTVANRGNASPLGWKTQRVNLEATFVRFLFSNPNGDPMLGGIAEVEILPATGDVASLPTETPTATPTPSATATPTATATTTPVDAYSFSMASRSSASTHPSLVYDGNPATEWITYSSSVPTSAYIYVSLGGVKPVGEIRWVFATSGYADSFEIQLSNDRSNWTTIATRSNAPVGEWQSLAVSQDAHYVRFLFSNPNGTAKLGGIGEVQVYPPVSPGPADNSTEPPAATVTETPTATSTLTETVIPEETATEPPVIPTETATETATATATVTPTETVTEEPSLTETATEPAETVTEEATMEVAAETEIATEEPVAPWTPGPGLWPAAWSSSDLTPDGYLTLDGEPLTDWRTYPGTALAEAEMRFDLGQVTWVSELWWFVAADAPGGRFVVETSLDGETWQVIGERASPGNPGEWASMPVGQEARFIRIRFINDLGQDQLGGIAEVVILP